MADEKREMLGQEMCVHSKLTLGCAGCFVHLKRKAARLQRVEVDRRTLLAGLKAEVERLKAEAEMHQRDYERLCGFGHQGRHISGCLMAAANQEADRLEHLIKQAGGGG